MNIPDPSQLHAFDEQSDSPFHRAEQLIQSYLGVRDKMEQFGGRVIRDHFPQQHRDFYAEQAYLFAGHLDEGGWPWASILTGRPGFLNSPNPQRLDARVRLLPDDPLYQSLHTQHGLLPMGLLGVDLASRRRNRFSARAQLEVSSQQESILALHVQQSFGNCPQYIQKRQLTWLQGWDVSASSSQSFEVLDAPLKQWIDEADTFFVSSANHSNIAEASSENFAESEDTSARDGVDVSHRGGRPGFIKIEGEDTLIIPDYAGNLHFNTLGNFMEYPRAGLLFIDFEQRRLAQLTGTVEVLWNDPRTDDFEGAERLWRFRLHRGQVIENALPFKFELDEFSPNTLLTSTWSRAEEVSRLRVKANQWQRVQVSRVEIESRVIRSFYLRPTESEGQPQFAPGQFVRVRLPKGLAKSSQGTLAPAVERTYSVSSSPWDEGYRISVKKESGGPFSTYLHEQIEAGDLLEIKAPEGGFYLDLDSLRPVILLAGGVGITPMVSMARAAYHHLIKTRSGRNVTLFAAARTASDRAFHGDLTALSQAQGSAFNYYSVLSHPEPNLKPGQDFNYQGYIDRNLLQSVLPLDDYEVYLCGPPGFMQSMYDLAVSLGVPDQRIFAESFGPAALQRQSIEPPQSDNLVAEAAEVAFSESGIEQLWTPEQGSLLEFAERHGLQPEFSCRSGQCGACKTRIESGRVVQSPSSSLPLAEDEVLLCCSRPAAPEAGEGNARLILSL